MLPSKAMAKVSCRLVPNQDPQKIGQLFDAHVQQVAPTGVTVLLVGFGLPGENAAALGYRS